MNCQSVWAHKIMSGSRSINTREIISHGLNINIHRVIAPLRLLWLNRLSLFLVMYWSIKSAARMLRFIRGLEIQRVWSLAQWIGSWRCWVRYLPKLKKMVILCRILRLIKCRTWKANRRSITPLMNCNWFMIMIRCMLIGGNCWLIPVCDWVSCTNSKRRTFAMDRSIWHRVLMHAPRVKNGDWSHSQKARKKPCKCLI